MKKFRIAINTRLLLPNKLEGIGWFTFEIAKRLADNHPEVDFYYFFDRKYSEEFITSDNITPIVLNPQARHPVLFDIWFEWSVKKALIKHEIDLFLSPDGFMSLASKIPSVAVIHDLNFEHFPGDLPRQITKYYKSRFPKFARKANRIITVSNTSKEDIVKCYKIKREKIDVVHNGVNEIYGPIEDYEKSEIKKKYTEGKDYFVYVGSMHRRKNIKRLLLAFDLFKKKTKSDVKLVLVGKSMWKDKELSDAFESISCQSDVIRTGRVFNEELNSILASSLALCYVPYFEGFGIPILEGFKCETPVITSNVSSMPEVAGDAAILIDPFDIENICQAMIDIFEKDELRAEYIARGRDRVKFFSWDKSAEGVWRTIKEVLD